MNIAHRGLRSVSLGNVFALAVAACAALAADQAHGQGGESFDGAVWNFSMKAKGHRLAPMRGRFRVSNHVLYQKESPEDKDFKKLVGKNFPQGKRTRVVFTELRARDNKGVTHEGIKASIKLKIDRAGQWSGLLIDAKGRHWNFRCTRIQE